METVKSEPEEILYVGPTICRNEDCGKVDIRLWQMDDGRRICTHCKEEELNSRFTDDTCDECGEDEQAIVSHGNENWCLDCMRQAGYCIVCDDYLPDKVDDYYNYENDCCPNCT